MSRQGSVGRSGLPVVTAGGRAVGGGAAVTAVAGWALGYVELLVVTSAGVLALVVALLWTGVRPRARLERTVAPDRVMRGESSDAHLTITVPASRLPTPRLLVRDRVGDRPVDTDLGRVPAGTTHRTTYALPTRRRGVVSVGPLGTLRTDPLGLLRAENRFGQESKLWVYPKVYDVVPLSAGRKRDLEGPTHDGASGSITFHALREYVTGDDLRLIHWRSTARTGTLMVRQQADPSRPYTTVVVDTHRASYRDEESFEGAVDVAASVLAASTGRRFPVRLVTGSGLTIAGSAGRSAANLLLDQLTTLGWSDHGRLAELAPRMSRDPGGNSLVVVTGSADAGAGALVEVLRRRYMTLAVVRLEPGTDAGAAWDRGVLDLVVPTAEQFAAVWNHVA